jgi:preprotein translocase subunit SecB
VSEQTPASGKETPASSQDQPAFGIEKIYVKDLSLEVPNAPQVFLQAEQPQIEVQLGQSTQQVQPALFEVALKVTVTAKAGDKTLFLAEAEEAALFQIRNVPQEEMGPLLGVVCPNILFPYARETISDLINRAGFPPVLLAPIDFATIYQQRMAEAQNPKIEIAH